jgi:hypothetical protein
LNFDCDPDAAYNGRDIGAHTAKMTFHHNVTHVRALEKRPMDLRFAPAVFFRLAPAIRTI